MRLIRVHLGRVPHPEGIVRIPFILAFLVVPPMVLGALVQPASSLFGGIAWVPMYAALLAAIAIGMWVTAKIARVRAPRRWRPPLLLALVASEGEHLDNGFDQPLTAPLAESQSFVDVANAVFPRGPKFPAQVDRPDFRAAWDALDAATRTLEGRIADDEGRGLGVASSATASAEDARGRLETLRTLASDGGQAWARI
jgi:soluble lytic murein transglycosylase-like protein